MFRARANSMPAVHATRTEEADNHEVFEQIQLEHAEPGFNIFFWKMEQMQKTLEKVQ